MECQFDPTKISAYLDGELALGEIPPVEDHLKSCQECVELIRELRRTDEIFGDCARREPPAEYWNQSAASLKEKLARTELPQPVRLKSFTLRWFGPAAAGILIVLVSYFIWKIIAIEPDWDDRGIILETEDKTDRPSEDKWRKEDSPAGKIVGKTGAGRYNKVVGKTGDGMNNRPEVQTAKFWQEIKSVHEFIDSHLLDEVSPVVPAGLLVSSEAVLLNYLNLDENNQMELGNFLSVMNESGMAEKIRANKNSVQDPELQKHFKRFETVFISMQNDRKPDEAAV
ncbi:MAG: zf-HC2 domain-containing protein, partial [Planctomycetota bacterium]